VADKKSKSKVKGERSGGADNIPEEQPAKSVPHVWDAPNDELDPPSQRPEDTHEEDLWRRRAG
jgi:hypothetical protein